LSIEPAIWWYVRLFWPSPGHRPAIRKVWAPWRRMRNHRLLLSNSTHSFYVFLSQHRHDEDSATVRSVCVWCMIHRWYFHGAVTTPSWSRQCDCEKCVCVWCMIHRWYFHGAVVCRSIVRAAAPSGARTQRDLGWVDVQITATHWSAIVHRTECWRSRRLHGTRHQCTICRVQVTMSFENSNNKTQIIKIEALFSSLGLPLRRWRYIPSSDNRRPICSTLMSRSDIHHRPTAAVLTSFVISAPHVKLIYLKLWSFYMPASDLWV